MRLKINGLRRKSQGPPPLARGNPPRKSRRGKHPDRRNRPSGKMFRKIFFRAGQSRLAMNFLRVPKVTVNQDMKIKAITEKDWL